MNEAKRIDAKAVMREIHDIQRGLTDEETIYFLQSQIAELENKLADLTRVHNHWTDASMKDDILIEKLEAQVEAQEKIIHEMIAARPEYEAAIDRAFEEFKP